MIGLLIITHETLGFAYTQLANHFFPNYNFDHIHILSVEINDDHDTIINRAHHILPELNRGYGVLILTDIFGATPCNAAMKLVQAEQSAMITGLNAPMLIKAVSHSQHDRDLQHFVAKVKEAGLNGIMTFTE